MSKFFVRAAVLAALAFGVAAPAHAADPTYCNRYAAAAIEAAGENLGHHCGYGGPRWAANYAVHYGWCLNAAIPAAAEEWRARREGLAACFNR